MEKERIQDCQEAIENGLVAMEKKDFSDIAITRALEFLVPKGFRPVVEFCDENGNPKRRTWSSTKWNPETDEIVITFSPVRAIDSVAHDSQTEPAHSVGDLEEVCSALAEAETGRSFVSLKWFRDDFLPAKGYAWTKTPEDCYAVLTKAITDGWILTSKVTNPRAPQYPTTAIRVNRQRQSRSPGTPAHRFVPVPVSGEPLSRTILRDRGQR